MPRRMMLAGATLTGDDWLAVGKYFFDQGEYDSEKPIVKFYCPTCDCDFESITTPTRCTLCGSTDAGEQAVTMTHKGVSGKVFPFYIPVPP